MKIEEGKYYRTADGKKVGPARIITEEKPFYDFEWGRMVSCGQLYEIVGVLPEDALDTDLIEEWQDEHRTWKDLTDAEKGALLLAHHEGEVIQSRCMFLVGENWEDDGPLWDDEYAYRIKPEPKRETVTLYGEQSYVGFWGFDSGSEQPSDYSITFDLVDGEPDCASVKMEKL